MIDQRKIAKWTDENTWEEYSEVGKAVKADMVVGIDLESFSIYQGQTLYQGKADATIRVFDCRHGNKEVFEKTIRNAFTRRAPAWPLRNAPRPTFRQEFLMVLANQMRPVLLRPRSARRYRPRRAGVEVVSVAESLLLPFAPRK